MATILVVEDEPAIQELITLNLEQSGYSPLRANDAEQARRRPRTQHLVHHHAGQVIGIGALNRAVGQRQTGLHGARP